MSPTQKLLLAIEGEPCRRPPELGPTFGKPDRVAPLVVIVALSMSKAVPGTEKWR